MGCVRAWRVHCACAGVSMGRHFYFDPHVTPIVETCRASSNQMRALTSLCGPVRPYSRSAALLHAGRLAKATLTESGMGVFVAEPLPQEQSVAMPKTWQDLAQDFGNEGVGVFARCTPTPARATVTGSHREAQCERAVELIEKVCECVGVLDDGRQRNSMLVGEL